MSSLTLPRGISTASTSKRSHGGFVSRLDRSPADITEQVAIHRDYDTISVGMINDHFASIALENVDKLLPVAKQLHERISQCSNQDRGRNESHPG